MTPRRHSVLVALGASAIAACADGATAPDPAVTRGRVEAITFARVVVVAP